MGQRCAPGSGRPHPISTPACSPLCLYARGGVMKGTLPVTLPEWRQAWEVTRSRQHLAGE